MTEGLICKHCGLWPPFAVKDGGIPPSDRCKCKPRTEAQRVWDRTVEAYGAMAAANWTRRKEELAGEPL